jgi:tetratricopeptide (TPR) repeat protein
VGIRDSFKKIFTSRSDEDRSSLSKKVQESPQDPQARQKLGLFLLRQGEIVEGIDQLARTAVLYEKSGFTTKAIAVLRHMLKFDLSNLDLHKWLLRLQVQQGFLRDAQDQLMEIGSGSVRFQDDDQKIEFFRQVGESMKGSPLPSFLAADILISRKKFFEAISEMEKSAVHVGPSGMVPEFSTRMNALLTRAGDNPDMLEPLGFLWLAAGRGHEALPLLRRIGSSGHWEDSPEHSEHLAQVFRAFEEGRESVMAGAMSFADAVRKLLAPEPEPEPESQPEPVSPAPEGASSVPDDEEETEGSEDHRMVQDAVSRLQAKVQDEIGESDPDARYNLGIAYKEMGLLNEAAQEFRTARRSPSLFLGASVLLSETLGSMGEYDEAVAVLDEILSSDDLDESSALDVRYQKGLLAIEAGKDEEAREIFLSLFEVAPDYRDVRRRTEPFRQ